MRTEPWAAAEYATRKGRPPASARPTGKGKAEFIREVLTFVARSEVAMGTVSIGGFPSRSMAELTQSYLADHGIHAAVVADDAGGSAPHLSHATGGVYLTVGEEDAHRARQLLEQAQVDSGAATQYTRPSAVWINRVGRWALAAVLIGLVVAWVLPWLTQIGP